MSQFNDEHPHDNLLTAYALNGGARNIEDHIKSCPSCSRYVKEMRTIKKVLQSLPDEDVPERLRGTILKSIKNKNRNLGPLFDFEWTNWYKNPFIVVIGLVCAVIFLYIFFVFVL